MAPSAGGRPKVLMHETALVTHPWRERPLARFSKRRTSAGYRPWRGVKPKEKKTMKRTRASTGILVDKGVSGLTDKADASVGTGLALSASGRKQGADDEHTHSSAGDTSKEQLSAPDVVNNRGPRKRTTHRGDTVDQVELALLVSVADTGKTQEDGQEVCEISFPPRSSMMFCRS